MPRHGMSSWASSFHHASMPSSNASSRPTSRASSPTRAHPIRSTTLDTNYTSSSAGTGADPLDDYFAGGTSSIASTPVTPSYAGSEMWGGSTGALTPGGGYHHAGPVEILLDSEHLVLRGYGSEFNSAYLSGSVELNLAESTNVKEINMTLTGKAKVHFHDGSGTTGNRNHHYTHPVLTHDWSFLQGDKRHNHTIKAGHHSFPFSLMLDGTLPSSIVTHNGDGDIQYKLRANVVRSGFSSNFHTSKNITLHRMYMNEALEFNQTLEIENTWPGKVMYCFTLPYKAYAAGDDIPVHIKFMPLAKGVRVTSITSVLKEYTLTHTRHSQHPEQRVASSVKHELKHGKAYLVNENDRPITHGRPSHTPNGTSSSRAGPSGSGSGSGGAGASGSGSGSGSGIHALRTSTTNSSTSNSRMPSPSATPQAGRISLPSPGIDQPSGDHGHGHGDDASNASNPSLSTQSEEDLEIGDDEINTHFTIPVPANTTPSHSIHPVYVTHKIKWSCSISNADGHVSELRCALPIIILDHSMLEEARSASATTRALLFGETAAEDVQAIDLPSYSNHVYDRVATADAGSSGNVTTRQNTPLPSPHSGTPPGSRPGSRPGSPTGRRGSTRILETSTGTANDVPPRRQLSSRADSELLQSLGALRTHSGGTSPHDTQPHSRGPSQPLSRVHSRSGRSSKVNSRHGSRAGSRANSPDRNGNGNGNGSGSGHNGVSEMSDRRISSFTGLLSLPSSFKTRSHMPSKPILRTSGNSTPADDPHSRSYTNLNSAVSGSHVRIGGETRRHVILDDDDEDDQGQREPEADPMSRVPSYAIASRGFLGGGVVPIDSHLPTYDLSEGIERTRSEMDLARVRAEAQEAEEEGDARD